MTPLHPIVLGVIFKDIPDYPGYCVGDDGSVWSRHVPGPFLTLGEEWHRLVTSPDRWGYPTVHLYQDGKSRLLKVHALVLFAFVGPRPPGMVACHDPDPTPSNVAPTNLRWGTHKDNRNDMIRHGRDRKGVKHPMAKLTEFDVRYIRWLIEDKVPTWKIAYYFNVSPGTVLGIASGRHWAHLDS